MLHELQVAPPVPQLLLLCEENDRQVPEPKEELSQHPEAQERAVQAQPLLVISSPGPQPHTPASHVWQTRQV